MAEEGSSAAAIQSNSFNTLGANFRPASEGADPLIFSAKKSKDDKGIANSSAHRESICNVGSFFPDSISDKNDFETPNRSASSVCEMS